MSLFVGILARPCFEEKILRGEPLCDASGILIRSELCAISIAAKHTMVVVQSSRERIRVPERLGEKKGFFYNFFYGELKRREIGLKI